MKNLLIAAVVASLAACATSSPDVIQRGDAQRLSQVQDGTVLSIRPVTVDGSQSGVGTVAGGVIGGVAGSSVGGHREGLAVGVLGAVARRRDRQRGRARRHARERGRDPDPAAQRRAPRDRAGGRQRDDRAGRCGRARHDRRQDPRDARAAADDVGTAQLIRQRCVGAAPAGTAVDARGYLPPGAASRNATMLRVSSSRWPSKKCSAPATTTCSRAGDPANLRQPLVAAEARDLPVLLPNTSSTGTLMRNMSSSPLMMPMMTHASTRRAWRVDQVVVGHRRAEAVRDDRDVARALARAARRRPARSARPRRERSAGSRRSSRCSAAPASGSRASNSRRRRGWCAARRTGRSRATSRGRAR